MDRWGRVKHLVDEALSREGAERSAFLDEACAEDPSLRAEVESLLRYEHGGPLESAWNAERAGGGAQTTPEEDPKRPHPFRWVVYGMALALAVLFGVAVVELVRAGTTARSFGWSEAQTSGNRAWYVESVHPEGPAAGALRPGDRIVAVDGVAPVGPLGTWLQRRPLSEGDRYSVSFVRNGDTMEVTLSVDVVETSIAPSLTYLGISLIWCAVGLFIGYARPDRAVARLSCLSAVATGHVFLDVGLLRLTLNAGPLHGVLGFHFFSRFPDGAMPRGIWRPALVSLYLMGGALFAAKTASSAAAFAFGAEEAAHGVGVLLQRIAWMGNVAFLGAVVGILAVVPYKYRQVTDPDLRRRLRWVVFASCVALLPNFWWQAVSIAKGTVGPALSLFTNASSVAIPICMAYAIVKHRVLDIKVVVRRGLQYLLARRALQTAVMLPIAVLAFALVVHRDQTVAELVGENQWVLFWLGTAGVLLRFRQPVRLWLDRRFFAEQYDREQLLMGLLEDLGRLDSSADLAREVTSRLDAALHPKVLYVWYSDPVERATVSSTDPHLTPPDLPSGVGSLQWLAGHGVTTLPLEEDVEISRAEARWLTENGIHLIVPIEDSGERLVGALFLGEKKSEEPYSPSDRSLLQALATQAAVVRENLRLRARLSEEARVRHDVLARLDSSLPSLLKECPACGRCFDGALEHCEHDGSTLILSLPVPRTIDDKYRLDRAIGKGGMGAVYEAQDLRLERTVAVKILLGRQFGQQASLRRFRREARAAARLDHRNIVSVHDFGSLEGEGAYLVMERVRGATLRAVLQRTGALPPFEAAEWFEPLLDGVAAAHAQGIVHRDLKPENVIGERRDGSLAVKILDLGLAKLDVSDSLSAEPLTATGMVMGTFAYMAPEQLLGREVDHRADIFAVAVMLLETLIGRNPFRGDEDGFPSREARPSTIVVSGSTPPGQALAALLQRCLAVDPRERLASANAFRSELALLLRTKERLDLVVP